MSRRRRTGLVKIDFAVIETIAAEHLRELALAGLADDWVLSRKSSLHRRKDGSLTLCLIWRSGEGVQLASTLRGLRLEAS